MFRVQGSGFWGSGEEIWMKPFWDEIVFGWNSVFG